MSRGTETALMLLICMVLLGLGYAVGYSTKPVMSNVPVPMMPFQGPKDTCSLDKYYGA
jgi:hypothetical protein